MTNKERRYQDWIARIADYKASGLTMSAWCKANSFSKETLQYWLRKTKDAFPTTSQSSPRFMPLTVTEYTGTPVSTSSLIVHVGKASIELRVGFNPCLLREVVQALEAPC